MVAPVLDECCCLLRFIQGLEGRVEVQSEALGKHGRVEHLHRVPPSRSDMLIPGIVNALHLLQVAFGGCHHSRWCEQSFAQGVVQGMHAAVCSFLSLKEEALGRRWQVVWFRVYRNY